MWEEDDEWTKQAEAEETLERADPTQKTIRAAAHAVFFAKRDQEEVEMRRKGEDMKRIKSAPRAQVR